MSANAAYHSRPSSPFEEVFASGFGLSDGLPHVPFTDPALKDHNEIPQEGLVTKYDKMFAENMFNLQVRWTHHLRQQYPNLILTVIPGSNVNLLAFAAAGNAKAKLDTEHEGYHRIRGWASNYSTGSGSVAEAVTFGLYEYTWLREEFTIYWVTAGYNAFYFVLKEPAEGEHVNGHSAVTDKLIEEVAKWMTPKDEKIVYEYDGRWMASKALWQEVNKAKWDDVILDKQMKKELQEIATKFFDSKEIYDDLGVPWKRGILLHGPAGNGKTISIKALMHTLYARKKPVPSLYVKAVRSTYDLRNIFYFARLVAPCLLILEDIDTIVTGANRSYFFNEVDGLANNDGIMMLASTNHLERLDPGLSQRPSRFDRKYLFPLPDENERSLYCQYWRKKIQKTKNPPDFPEKLCGAIASITDRFSFAYLKEAFVATLLAIARKRLDEVLMDNSDDDNDLEQYELWREMVKTIKILRKEMGGQRLGQPQRLDTVSIWGEASPEADVSPAFERLEIRKPAPRTTYDSPARRERFALNTQPAQDPFQAPIGRFGGHEPIPSFPPLVYPPVGHLPPTTLSPAHKQEFTIRPPTYAGTMAPPHSSAREWPLVFDGLDRDQNALDQRTMNRPGESFFDL